eukprot:8033756-Alexandrium_andersonii.AAC.1
MDVGALEPESEQVDPDTQELQAALAIFQRYMGKGKGKGKGGKPSGTPGGPGTSGGAKGTGKGGPFMGRCWKCNEVGHRAN